MKLTLISPLPEIICLGLRNIAAYLGQHGIHTEIIFLADPEFEYTGKENEEYSYNTKILADVVELCRDSDLIGITLFSNQLWQAIQLTSALKKELIVPIIWGGKHPSAMPEMSLKYADIVALGECERSMLDLCQHVEKNTNYFKVKGFWFNHDEHVYKNPVGDLVENLDDIPQFTFVSEDQYIWKKSENCLVPMTAAVFEEHTENNPFIEGKAYHVMTSRGCPFSCSYCFTFKGLYKGKKYVRRRSVDHIIQELSIAKNLLPGLNLISIADDEFMSAGIAYINEFCAKYKEKIDLPFHCLIHPSTVTAEKLELLVDAGLLFIQMGIQTGSDETLKMYKRTTSNERTFESILLINKYKELILPSYDFILDNPFETKENLIETIRFIIQFPDPFTLTVFSLVFFPGTDLFNKAVENNLIASDETSSYLKKYQHLSSRYLNIIFLLLQFKVNSRFISFLISKPMVFIFERPFFTFINSFLMNAYRYIKQRRGIQRRASGGFTKQIEKVTQ